MLARTGEQYRVIPDDIAAADDGVADVALAAFAARGWWRPWGAICRQVARPSAAAFPSARAVPEGASFFIR